MRQGAALLEDERVKLKPIIMPERFWLQNVTVMFSVCLCSALHEYQCSSSEFWHHHSHHEWLTKGGCGMHGLYWAYWKARIVDFIAISVNWTFSLGVTAEALRAKLRRKSALSLQRSKFDPKFQVEGIAPTNHFCTDSKANECLTTL